MDNMKVSKIASQFGRMGGKATLKKHGKKHFRDIALAREAHKREQRIVDKVGTADNPQ